ncbi:MAG: hypothetical protein ACRDNS_19705, partial [Trebonia sp.]
MNLGGYRCQRILAVCARARPPTIRSPEERLPKRHKNAPPAEALYSPIEWRSAAEYGDIRYEKADRIAKITIARPEVRNAFRPQTLAELREAFG